MYQYQEVLEERARSGVRHLESADELGGCKVTGTASWGAGEMQPARDGLSCEGCMKCGQTVRAAQSQAADTEVQALSAAWAAGARESSCTHRRFAGRARLEGAQIAKKAGGASRHRGCGVIGEQGDRHHNNRTDGQRWR